MKSEILKKAKYALFIFLFGFCSFCAFAGPEKRNTASPLHGGFSAHEDGGAGFIVEEVTKPENLAPIILNTDKGRAKWEKEWWKGSGDSHGFHQPYLDGEAVFYYTDVQDTKDCKNNGNAVRRSVSFKGRICLEDTLTYEKPEKAARFRVFLEKPDTLFGGDANSTKTIKEIFHINGNGEEEPFPSDWDGCIDLVIPIKHNVYNRQRYFPIDIHFLSEESNYYARVRVALNPWQNAFHAHQDASKLSPKDIRFETTGVKKPNMIINQFKSVNPFPSYASDKSLSAHLYHRVDFLFQPFVQRPDNAALGLDHRAKELLREGYYMIRLLLLRASQETRKLQRVLTEEEVEERRKAALLNKERILNKDLDFDISGAEYITHQDTIASVEANSVNLYMPLYVTDKQLDYMASENLIISIEIVPADPSGFAFKEIEEGDECELDWENTKWRPYYKHELKSRPYVGAFNIQNRTNWNILQPVSKLDSDKIIDQSKTGGKYKLFNLSAGFYPGVYHYPEDSDKALDIIFKREGGDWEQWVFDGYRKAHNFLSVPTSPNNPIPVNEPE